MRWGIVVSFCRAQKNKEMELRKMSLLALSAVFTVGCSTMESHQQAEIAANENEKAIRKEAVEVQLDSVKTPDEALRRLVEGNWRYAADSCLNPHHNRKRVAATAPQQQPFAAVIACSDSRVPVELLFDQGIGDLFVIRTAGNSVNDDVVMGSVDYAVEHLGVKAVVVLGHESCGGVTGAITETGRDDESKVDELLSVIRNDVKPYVGHKDSLDVAVRLNAKVQVDRILASKRVQKRVADGQLVVKAGYYNVHSGKVEF